ncbi:MAG: SMI1/KNR4 family protein [Cyanothece sp. SIO2G6]|nr:SMI1/KNR4 family protein [Cyanothece sp. SIO2G6]
MNITEWEAFLRQESQKAISAYLEEKDSGNPDLWEDIELEQEIIDSGWLGLEGALEREIVATEELLEINLPPSYRNFLRVTNGWNTENPELIHLYSVQEVCWFRDQHQDWIDIWVNSEAILDRIPDAEYFVYGKDQEPSQIREDYLQTALKISTVYDGDVVLLNPQIIVDGEWEAWIFSNSSCGAHRYESFSNMLKLKGLSDSWL